MSVQNNDSKQSNHIFLTRFVRKVNPFINFIFYSIILATILDIIATVISQPLQIPPVWKEKLQFIFNWGINSWPFVLAIFAVLFLYKYTFSKLEGIEIPEPLRKLERKYLKSVKNKTEMLVLKGLPANRKGFTAQLSSVFYPPEFIPNTHTTDFIPKYPPLEDYHKQVRKDSWVFPPAENVNEQEKIRFDKLWHGLTKERPVAIILGYPGMGKSTLLAGLALHMAMRHLYLYHYTIDQIFTRLKLNRFVPRPSSRGKGYGLPVFQGINPTLPRLVPLLLNLREYALYLGTSATNCTITDFIKQQVRDYYPLVKKHLDEGICIVLLDGLDEVSKDVRSQVQAEIKDFIDEFKNKEVSNFNRFIITSRNASFDQNIIPDTECYSYTIADLAEGQIEDILKAYYCAFVSNHPDFSSREEELIGEAIRRARNLYTKIIGDTRIRQLAENPLLLYLLAIVVFRKGPDTSNLPGLRVDLYNEAVKYLLEGHNTSRLLPSINEAQTIECLGSIAVKMLEDGQTLLHRDDVERLVKQSIQATEERQVEEFLHRIRE